MWEKKVMHFLVFIQFFQKAFSSGASKVLCVEGLEYPFISGVGGGFTLKHEAIQFHLSVLYSSSKKDRENVNRDRNKHNRLIRESREPEGLVKYDLVPAVQDFCQVLDGFVYVVDASQDQPAGNFMFIINDTYFSPFIRYFVNLKCLPGWLIGECV